VIIVVVVKGKIYVVYIKGKFVSFYFILFYWYNCKLFFMLCNIYLFVIIVGAINILVKIVKLVIKVVFTVKGKLLKKFLLSMKNITRKLFEK
jgi:hypothetical protein